MACNRKVDQFKDLLLEEGYLVATNDLLQRITQGLVKGAKLCLNPYFFGWLEKYSSHVKNKSKDF